MEKAVGTSLEREHWTTCADHARMTLATLELPLIGAANEEPRLRKQPGFPLYISRGLILPNLAIPEAARQ